MTSNKQAKNIARALLAYLRKSGNSELLKDVVDELTTGLEEQKSVVVVTVPTKLSAKNEQLSKELVRKVIGTLHNITYRIDPKIIDGIQIAYKDTIWDYSFASFVGQEKDT